MANYSLTVMEHVDSDCAHSRNTWHEYESRDLARLWRIAERHARRGFNRHGGTIQRANWGVRGGDFPRAYRSATIRLVSL